MIKIWLISFEIWLISFVAYYVYDFIFLSFYVDYVSCFCMSLIFLYIRCLFCKDENSRSHTFNKVFSSNFFSLVFYQTLRLKELS